MSSAAPSPTLTPVDGYIAGGYKWRIQLLDPVAAGVQVPVLLGEVGRVDDRELDAVREFDRELPGQQRLVADAAGLRALIDRAEVAETFVNDVVVTSRAAYFTDSYQPVLYVVPLDRFGRLPGQAAVRTVQLPGGLGDVAGFNNGIEAMPDGRLIIVQMLAGRLYSYDPGTNTAALIDTGGASVLQGDGLLRRGQYLYVVRNFFNVIAKFRLRGDLSGATLVEEITHPAFQIPATVAGFGSHLYAVNGRFDVEAPGPDTTYSVVRVDA